MALSCLITLVLVERQEALIDMVTAVTVIMFGFFFFSLLNFILILQFFKNLGAEVSVFPLFTSPSGCFSVLRPSVINTVQFATCSHLTYIALSKFLKSTLDRD